MLFKLNYCPKIIEKHKYVYIYINKYKTCVDNHINMKSPLRIHEIYRKKNCLFDNITWFFRTFKKLDIYKKEKEEFDMINTTFK